MDSWAGACDEDELPHGRGTLILADGVRYEGRVSHGKRKGQGTLFVDEGDGRESALRVRWHDDMPHGPGSFLEADGGLVTGAWCNGALEGLAHEEHADGTLRFLGQYVEGERTGEGMELRADGGCLVGHWRSGVLHGRRCAYLYPCAAEGAALVGEWREGVMLRAHAVVLLPQAIAAGGTSGGDGKTSLRGGGGRSGSSGSGSSSSSSSSSRRRVGTCRRLPPLPAAAVHSALPALLDTLLHQNAAAGTLGSSGGIFGGGLGSLLTCLFGRRDPYSRELAHQPSASAATASSDAPASDAPISDEPYESRRVVVRRSGVAEGAGEGLYAARRLGAGEVAVFFGGVRVEAEGAEVEKAATAESDAAAPDGGSSRGCVSFSRPPSGIDADWAVLAADGSWLHLPPSLRSLHAYRASLGHKANHAGWRANCELVDFEHPALGTVKAVRVLPSTGWEAAAEAGEVAGEASARWAVAGETVAGEAAACGGVAAGTELTVAYDHLIDLREEARPGWLKALLAQRTEVICCRPRGEGASNVLLP